MILSQRLLHGLTTLGMGGGTIVLLVAGLASTRDGLTGVLAHVVPNLAVSPLLTVAAVATVVASAGDVVG